jgi:hypothetical protein
MLTFKEMSVNHQFPHNLNRPLTLQIIQGILNIMQCLPPLVLPAARAWMSHLVLPWCVSPALIGARSVHSNPAESLPIAVFRLFFTGFSSADHVQPETLHPLPADSPDDTGLLTPPPRGEGTATRRARIIHPSSEL